MSFFSLRTVNQFQIARYGRGFDNGPLRAYAPLTVRRPQDLVDDNTVLQRNALFTEDKAPVFDLQKMLEEQEIKRRIAEANRSGFQFPHRIHISVLFYCPTKLTQQLRGKNYTTYL